MSRHFQGNSQRSRRCSAKISTVLGFPSMLHFHCCSAVATLLQLCCTSVAPPLHHCCTALQHNIRVQDMPASLHGTQNVACTPIILCAKNQLFSPYLQKKSLAAPKIYVEMRIGWDWGGGEGIVGSNHPGSPRQGAKGRSQLARPYGHPPTSSLPRRHSTPRSPGWFPAELSWLNLLLHK